MKKDAGDETHTEHSAWIRRLGVRVRLRSRPFLSQKLWHFHRNTRSFVKNKCCCPRTVNISNVNFTLKNIYTARASVQNMGQQMSGPDSSIGKSIRHESQGWGFESPSGRDIFCLKNFDTFTRTPVRVSKINAVVRAQLTFQILTLLQNNMYIDTWYLFSKTLIAHEAECSRWDTYIQRSNKCNVFCGCT